MNLLRHFGKTLWAGTRPIARPVRTQNNTTQKVANIHPCPQRDSKPQPGSYAHQTARPLGQAVDKINE